MSKLTEWDKRGMRTPTRDAEQQAAGHARRFARRSGMLAPVLGTGAEVRCSCDRCGAHLLAIAVSVDRYEGVCLVCGGDEITPV